MIINSKMYEGACSCGHNHPIFTKKLVIEAGCLSKIGDYFLELNLQGPSAAIYDTNTYNAKGLVHPSVDQAIILESDNLHANEKAVEKVLEQLNKDVRILIAIGSGTIHDITRYCANKLGITFVSCPTAASVDGFCSTISAMTWNGYKKTMPGVAPILVLADLDIIRQAPIRLALSGVGDLLGKFTSLADWKIAHVLTGEYLCTVIEDLTRQAVVAANDCCENIKENGEEKAFEQLTYGLLLSGIAMQMLGNSRPASGSEHHISHLIEMDPPALNTQSPALHGEKVGVAAAIVSGIYHRLAEISDISSYVKEYSPLDLSAMSAFFGSLISSVELENKGDCLESVTTDSLITNWQKIRDIVAEIPTEEALLNLYEKIGAKRSLGDIAVDEKLLPEILNYSPSVRNRLTLMRIRRILNL